MRLLISLHVMMFLCLPGLAQAEVDPEVRALVDAHHAKRAEGLMRLNEAFVPKFEEVHRELLDDREIEKADLVTARIAFMKEEIEQLKQELAKIQARNGSE